MHKKPAKTLTEVRSRRESAKPKGVPAATAADCGPVDLTEVRRQIRHLVEHRALGMVETTIEEVSKGHYLGMKYLFEMIGLYPAEAADGSLPQESMATILLQRLGLADIPKTGEKVTKDSDLKTRTSGDGLE
jgi:hypothetical protein